MASRQPTSGKLVALRCDECGSIFSHITAARGRLPRSCSDACRQVRRNQHDRAAYVPRPRVYTRTIHSLTCVECNLPFRSNDRRKSCCSQACGWRVARRKQNLWRAREAAKRHARTCKTCGRAFTMSRPSGKANRGLINEGQFCSRECAGNAKGWPSYEERRRAIKRMRRRATFKPRDVFERDGWRCLLCGDGVSSELAYPNPGSPCINHIVPTSKGGKRVWSNVALAHLTCAVFRRARDASALRS